MAQPAGVSSSSSSFTCDWTYDVFLSFRGEDTRNTFTSNLYHSLDQKGIYSFIDDEELRRGDEIGPALLQAIQESRIAIIVFSKNYAQSTFCLDELVKILELLKAQGRLVWPIFYDVDPSDVRHQKKGSYADALAKHEQRFRDDKGKVQKWRDALHEAANLSGWHFKPGSQPEYKFIDNIVGEISKKLNHTPLHVADNPVGLQSPMLEVESLIEIGSTGRVDMVGICGTGGIGKTTIARAVYNSIADQFDGLCFLADIRENTFHKRGLVKLQKKLLSEILGKNDIEIGDVNTGIPLIKRRLQRKKILLILDDVDDRKQLKALAGGRDWFGAGSRVIITSRDKHLLSAHGVDEKKIYDVRELNIKEALELFSWNAFRINKVNSSYADVLSRALSYVGGLPLALEVIGSNLYNKSIDEWNSALDKYERIPNTEVDKILKFSYDGLEEDEKSVFLDIACFFNKYEGSYVKEMLHARGFHPEDSMKVLINKSLMKIDKSNGCVRMHDLIQDMGREIVRKESIEPGERSRLWFDEDIVRVLQNDMGTAKVEAIVLYSSKHEVCWNGKAFKKMRNLRVLIVGDVHFSIGPEHLPNSLRVLDWSGYPSPSLPCDFHPNEFLILSLPHGCFKLDKPLKVFGSLGFMDFEGCKFLVQVPNLSGLPSLRALCLDNCTNLTKVDNSIGFLDKLILLSAQGCIKLHTLVPAINLPLLETLDLSWCTSLQRFPEVEGVMENIQEVYLDHTAIQELPDSIYNLIGLERLYLRRCESLYQLPGSIGLLPKLEVILFHKQRGFRFYDPCKEQEAVVSREFICAPPNVHDSGFAFAAESTIRSILGFSSPPRDLTLSGSRIIARNGSFVSFWVRKTFPEVTLLLIWEPPFGMEMHGSVFEFSICVLINGTFRFSPSHLYVFPEVAAKLPKWVGVSLTDLVCRIPQDVLKKVLSAHEWNHVEVSCNLKHRMPYDPKWVCEGHNRSITRTIKHSIIHVFERSSLMKDIKFADSEQSHPYQAIIDHYKVLLNEISEMEDIIFAEVWCTPHTHPNQAFSDYKVLQNEINVINELFHTLLSLEGGTIE